MPDPNLLAYAVMLLFIPATIAACALMPLPAAAISVSLIGWMYLPERVGFDVPVIKPVDKHTLVPLLLFLCFVFMRPGRVLRWRPGWGIGLCIVVLLVGSVGTALTNGDTIVIASTVLPPLTFHDLWTSCIRETISVVVPFVVGQIAVQSAAELRLLLVALVLGGLAYSGLVLFEVRFSPQLHTWLYGFHQHSFLQEIRGTGFRPTVFMSHGLTASMFMFVTVLAAIGLARAKVRVLPVSLRWIALFLAVVLLLCKSMGAIIYAGVLGSMLAWLRPRILMRAAVVLSLIACAYPLFRSSSLFPRDTMLSLASSANEDRAGSLKFRLDNEEQLLAKAMERPWFGWGGWGRNKVYNEYGWDVSITDGGWIIMLGMFGFVGWSARMGMLVIPVWAAMLRWNRVPSPAHRIFLATLASIAGAYLIDMLPNSFGSTCIDFLFGCLFGATRTLRRPSTIRPASRSTPAPQGVLRSTPPQTHTGQPRSALG